MSTPAARPVDPTSPPHRGPGRAAGHPGPHSVRNRYAVARAKAFDIRLVMGQMTRQQAARSSY